jgi:hypothetical protein
MCPLRHAHIQYCMSRYDEDDLHTMKKWSVLSPRVQDTYHAITSGSVRVEDLTTSTGRDCSPPPPPLLPPPPPPSPSHARFHTHRTCHSSVDRVGVIARSANRSWTVRTTWWWSLLPEWSLPFPCPRPWWTSFGDMCARTGGNAGYGASCSNSLRPPMKCPNSRS